MEQNGVQILLQSLEKKNRVLDGLIGQNAQQETLLKQEELDMEAFDRAIDSQNELLEELDRLDGGFETYYDRVREDIIANKDKYRDEILKMQQQIQQITDKIATINAGNMRNKLLAENQFKKERQAIKDSTSQTRVARNYYNNMRNLNNVAPQFYDSKK